MATSITDAAFEGFRVLVRRPVTVIGWGLFGIFTSIVLGGVMLLTIGPMMFARFAEIASGAGATPTATPDINSVLAMFGVAFPVILAGALIINAVQIAAIYRAVLNPAERGWAYLRLGGDEWRLILMTLAMFLLGGLTFGLAIVGLVFAVAASGDAGFLLAFVGGIGLFCAWVWVAVRLSLAAAVTFAQKRVDLFGSWGLTRGRFWPLFGMYLLVFVLSLVVGLVGSSLAQVFASMGLLQLMQAWAQNPTELPDPAAAGVPMAQLVIALVGYIVMALLANVVQLAVVYAPHAAVYRFLTGPPLETTSEVFS